MATLTSFAVSVRGKGFMWKKVQCKIQFKHLLEVGGFMRNFGLLMLVVICPKQAALSKSCLSCAFMQEREKKRERKRGKEGVAWI